MSTKINVRSPYYVSSYNASASYSILKLYVHDGSKPATPQYTIKKYANDDNYSVFEISKLVRDYIEPYYQDNYAFSYDECKIVDSDITIYNSSDVSVGTSNTSYTAFDGYGYFDDGLNPELSRTLMQTNNIIYRYINDVFVIPVFTEDVTNVEFLNDSVSLASLSVSTGSFAVNKIHHAYSNALGGLGGFLTRMEDEKLAYSDVEVIDSICLQQFYKAYDLYDVDEVILTTSSGTETLTVVNISECKYTPVKISFLNKLGAFQDIWFFKKSSTKLDVSREKYTRNLFESFEVFGAVEMSYNTQKHQQQIYNTIGNETIKLNTGFIDEQYSEVIKQLLLSENVVATIKDDASQFTEKILPVNIDTNSLDIQTKLNDKLINYTLDFSFAFNKINDVT